MHAYIVMQSRRYGHSYDDTARSPTWNRQSIDDLASSSAPPPPDVYSSLPASTSASQSKSRTLLSALQNFSSHPNAQDDEWTDSEEEDAPFDAGAYGAEPSHVERSFLTEMRQREQLQQHEMLHKAAGLDDDVPARRIPAPTVSDEEDIDAPKTAPAALRVRTAMQDNLDEGTLLRDTSDDGEVPVATATATALERLVDPAEEDEAKYTRRKKKSSKGEAGEDGTKKKKKKKDRLAGEKDTTKRRKKRVSKAVDSDSEAGHHAPLAALADLMYEPLSVPVPPVAEEGEAEPDETASMAPLSDMPTHGHSDEWEPTSGKLTVPVVTASTMERSLGRDNTSAVISSTATRPVVPSAPASQVHSLALEERPHVRNVPPTSTALDRVAARKERMEQNKMHLFNFNATRLAVNTYILYWGMFATLRRLWRWEKPWVTGSVAALYVIVWWRGDLLAVFFLAAFLYAATFRVWQVPAMNQDEGASDSGVPKMSNSLTRRGTETLSLVSLAPSADTLRQVGDQVLVVAHGLADMQERVKNLMMWRNPIMTLRYLGWLILFGLLSMQVTTWMLMRLPGAVVFVFLFVLAPIVEYGHWYRIIQVLCGLSGANVPDPNMPYAVTRTLLDSVLAGVPTDEEYLHERLAQTHWEAERELRRLGEWVDSNRIVEETDEIGPRRHPTRLSQYPRHSTYTWSDVPGMDALQESSRSAHGHGSHYRRRPKSEVGSRVSAMGVDRVASDDDRLRHAEIESLSDYGSQVVHEDDGDPTRFETDDQLHVSWQEQVPPKTGQRGTEQRATERPMSTVLQESVTLPSIQAPRTDEVPGSATPLTERSLSQGTTSNAANKSATPVATPSVPAASLPALSAPGASPAQLAPALPNAPGPLASPIGAASAVSSTLPASPPAPSAVPASMLASPNAEGNVSMPTLSTSNRAPGAAMPRHASYSALREYESPYIPARSEGLQAWEQERRQSRLKQAAAMTPPVPTETMHFMSSPTVTSTRPGASTAISRPSLDMGFGLHLAVFRKRLGHLIVLPTRVVFLLSYGPHRRTEPPSGLTREEEERLIHSVDGRMFFPMMAPIDILTMIEQEMDGHGFTDFEIAAVPLARMPKPNDILFEVPSERIVGLKKLRKSTPVLNQCTEGLEIVLSENERGIGMPAVMDRDLAFQRILALTPHGWDD